jgi:hypothetical protein
LTVAPDGAMLSRQGRAWQGVVTIGHALRRFTMYEEEDYRKACAALQKRCERSGWLYNQPSRYDAETNSRGILILRNCRRELGRYDTRKQRLIALRSI